MEATSKQHFNDHSAQGCMLSIFVPIIQILDIVSQKKKREFMQGEGEIFTELCENIPSLSKLVCRFGNNRNDDKESYREGFEIINKAYMCTFGKNEQYDGELNLSADLKNICIRVCNGN